MKINDSLMIDTLKSKSVYSNLNNTKISNNVNQKEIPNNLMSELQGRTQVNFRGLPKFSKLFTEAQYKQMFFGGLSLNPSEFEVKLYHEIPKINCVEDVRAIIRQCTNENMTIQEAIQFVKNIELPSAETVDSLAQKVKQILENLPDNELGYYSYETPQGVVHYLQNNLNRMQRFKDFLCKKEHTIHNEDDLLDFFQDFYILERRLTKEQNNKYFEKVAQKLHYESTPSNDMPLELTSEEVEELRAALQKRAKNFKSSMDYSTSTPEQLMHSWRTEIISDEGAPRVSDVIADKCLSNGKIYNSSLRGDTPEEWYDGKYELPFKYEPVYRWENCFFDKNYKHLRNPEKFIDDKYKVGDIITFDDSFHSFSKDINGAESSMYNDNVQGQNVKLVIHPKREQSQAIDLGFSRWGNLEVIYRKGSQFKVIDKRNVGTHTQFRKEIHLQEL